jgi:hypothetical protein
MSISTVRENGQHSVTFQDVSQQCLDLKMLPTKTNVILRTQQSLSKTTGRKRFPRLRRLQTELFRYGLELADYGFRRSAGSVGDIEAMVDMVGESSSV